MSAPRTSAAPRGVLRRGSTFSDKQIASAVKDGKVVQMRTQFGDLVSGWICGFDDFHWGIVDARREVHLVHKSAGLVTILPDSVVVPPEVEDIVAPCRDYVMREFFGKTPTPATT